MKIGLIGASALLLALATTTGAQAATPIAAKAPTCTPAGDCTAYKHLLNLPVGALSYGFGTFTPHPRGLNWADNAGEVTLTVQRPADFKGDKVRLTLVYETLSDESGDITFGVTAISFHHGSSFETYGGFATDTVTSPESPTILLQQSAVVETGQGWGPDGPWWYFEINRLGTYNASLRLMAVTLEY